MPAYRDPSSGRFVARDGLANLASGAGTSADKRTFAFYTQPFILPEQVKASYRSSWMMRKGIDLPPFDMTRNGRDWQLDEADVAKIEKEEKRLGLWAKLRQALVLGRLGGGLIIMGLPGDPTQPITDADKQAGGLKYLHVMNRWQVALGQIVTDPADELFGQPAYFEIRFGKLGATGSVRIHPSRVIAFRGKPVPNLRSASSDDWFWGDPLMVSVADTVKNADAAMNGFASLIEEAKLDTVTIPGLTQMLATAEGEQLVTKRVQVANLLKSTHNTRILDGGRGKDSPGEEWDTRQVTWTGMPDMIRVYAAAVAGAFDIPATRFLGKSPDGMNATGAGDESNYIAKIRADQDSELRPALDAIDAVMLPSAGVTLTDEAWYDFPPLQEMSELDKANIFKTRMEGVTALQNTGTIPAEAFDKAVQNTAVEEQWLAGLDGALAEVPDDERFPSKVEPLEPDPLALTEPKGGDPASQAPSGRSMETAPRRRAANDALRALGLTDAQVSAARVILEVGDKPSLPFGDAYDPSEPRDPHGRWTRGGIAEHVTRALRSGKEHSTTSLGKVSEANAALVLRHTGISIGAHERVLQSSDIRHVFNSHGDQGREALRGQVAIRKADFAHIPAIVEKAHLVRTIGQSKAVKPQRLEYTARIDGHEYHYVEELRPNQVVALKSMRKKL